MPGEHIFLNLNASVMKKFFISTILILISTSLFCQQSDIGQPVTQNSYLQKSKNQKTTAWILLGAGFVLSAGAAVADVGSDWTKSETPYLVAIVTGCASMLGSIPLFIAAGRNKRKAKNAAAYFKIQLNRVPTNTGLALHSTPTLSLKLGF